VTAKLRCLAAEGIIYGKKTCMVASGNRIDKCLLHRHLSLAIGVYQGFRQCNRRCDGLDSAYIQRLKDGGGSLDILRVLLDEAVRGDCVP
jgi:hypothetical protein